MRLKSLDARIALGPLLIGRIAVESIALVEPVIVIEGRRAGARLRRRVARRSAQLRSRDRGRRHRRVAWRRRRSCAHRAHQCRDHGAAGQRHRAGRAVAGQRRRRLARAELALRPDRRPARRRRAGQPVARPARRRAQQCGSPAPRAGARRDAADRAAARRGDPAARADRGVRLRWRRAGAARPGRDRRGGAADYPRPDRAQRSDADLGRRHACQRGGRHRARSARPLRSDPGGQSARYRALVGRAAAGGAGRPVRAAGAARRDRSHDRCRAVARRGDPPGAGWAACSARRA